MRHSKPIRLLFAFYLFNWDPGPRDNIKDLALRPSQGSAAPAFERDQDRTCSLALSVMRANSDPCQSILFSCAGGPSSSPQLVFLCLWRSFWVAPDCALPRMETPITLSQFMG